MKAAEKASKGGEISMAEKQSANGGEVIVEVQSDGISEAKGSSSKASSSKASESSAPKQSKVNLRVSTESSTSAGFSEPVPVGFPSTDISRASPNPGKPLRVPTCNESLNRRKSFNRSVTKPKSRFGEPSPVMNEDGTEDQIGANSPNSPNRASLSRGSLNNTSGVGDISIPSAGNALSSPGKTEDMEDEEIYKKVYKRREVNSRKVNKIILIELIVFLCILGCLVASLTVQKLENYMVWGLEIWKWLVLVMVIFSGMLVTNWVMHFIIFGIERNFLLRRKVLYFVHGMKKSIQVLMWWSLILVTWLLLLKPGLEQSKISTKILAYVTRSIVSVLIGAFLWLIKILLLKILASKIEAFTYSERIQESIFHHYVLQTLSGPPLMEEADGQIGFRATKKSKAGKKKVVIDRSRRTKQVKVSSWTMKVLADAVTSSGLSTISHTLDEMEGLNEQRDKEITSEMEATTAAYDIFLNVAQLGASYIEEWDLLKFMTEEEAEDVWLLLDVANTGKVDRKTVTEWVVRPFTLCFSTWSCSSYLASGACIVV
ncbi:hypothetical protein M0R45_000769 [Rubus argutus]|uniref:Uncharacterized protein n=1 Tax=Rubus argutus TaxID=59490 RepID=A0AAW1VNG4_RUBAR